MKQLPFLVSSLFVPFCAFLWPSPSSDRWLLLHATKLPSEFTNQESGYFSIVEGKNGRIYVSVTDLIGAGMVSAERAKQAGNPKDSIELLRLRQTTTSLREQLATATATLMARDAEIERTCGQLREKDTQITRLLKIIEQHTARTGQR